MSEVVNTRPDLETSEAKGPVTRSEGQSTSNPPGPKGNRKLKANRGLEANFPSGSTPDTDADP